MTRNRDALLSRVLSPLQVLTIFTLLNCTCCLSPPPPSLSFCVAKRLLDFGDGFACGAVWGPRMGRDSSWVMVTSSSSSLFLSVCLCPSVCFFCRRFFEGVSHSGSQTEISSLHGQKGQERESGSPVSYSSSSSSSSSASNLSAWACLPGLDVLS